MEMNTKIQTSKFHQRKRKFQYMKDETLIKVNTQYLWLDLVAFEPEGKEYFRMGISKGRKYVCWRTFYLSDVVEEHRERPVSTNNSDILYPRAYRFLKLEHHLHSIFEEYYKKDFLLYNG